MVWRFVDVVSVLGKTYTALSDAMRPLPSLLLLCGSYVAGPLSSMAYPPGPARPRLLHRRGRHHHRHDSVDRHGSSNVCAAMDKPCTLYASHHLGARHVRAQPQSSRKISMGPVGLFEHVFEPTVCVDNPFLKVLSINFELWPEHSEDMYMCASPHTTSQAIEHMPQPAPEASFTHSGHFDFPPLRSPLHVHS